jgi:hypothetical protein
VILSDGPAEHAVASGPPGTIATFAGSGVGGYGGDGGTATAAGLNYPTGLAVDAAGDLYISHLASPTSTCRVRKVAGGTITTAVGNGTCGYGGDGGPATAALINSPLGLAYDAAGNLYIADGCRVRKVAGGTITTVAGTGSCGFSGDGGPATSAKLFGPWGLALDGAGNLYIGDRLNCRVRKVTGGTITTVAGNGTCAYGGDGGAATAASLNDSMYGIALDSAGNLYIGDSDLGSCRVRKVTAGTITTVAGNGTCGYGGDGGAATAANLGSADGVALDSDDNLYITDALNCRVRKVNAIGGAITTVAGNGTCGFSGDGGAATSAEIISPTAVALDADDNLYFGTLGAECRVRKVASGTITTVAGNGTCAYGGDAPPATAALLNNPIGVAVDSANDLYIADTNNCRVRKAFDGAITTVAGNGTCGFGGDGGPATSAMIAGPWGAALDVDGNLYIADKDNCRVRKVTGGTITTVAGSVTCGDAGDTGPATSALLDNPTSVAVDAGGNLYIADSGNCRVRKVTGGTITAFAGSGTCGYSGDGGAATAAMLSDADGVAVNAAGDLYIADTSNCRVRKVTSGMITTVAGTGTCGFGGDLGSATSAMLNGPWGIALDAAGDLYIGDRFNCRVRKVANDIITTVAGNGTCGYTGDGGVATAAQLNDPLGVAVDSAGNLYVADFDNDVVRVVYPCNGPGDSDCDGVLDGGDNCASVHNATQANSDSGPTPPAGNVGFISNGSGVPGDDLSVPNGDALGDACDDDDDNDGLPDADDSEPLGATGICAAFAGSSSGHAAPTGGDVGYSDGTPPSWDTDGDAVPDARECIVGTNPRVGDGAHRGMCAATTGAGDADGDGLQDVWEVCGWGTSASNTNGDGDGLGDCVEVMDVNGSGVGNNNDAVLVKQHFFGIIVGDRAAMDINRSATVNNNDAVLIQQAFFGVNPCS